MGDWVVDNIVNVVGWIGAIVAFAWLGGRKLARLEDADRALAVTVTALTTKVDGLSNAVHGQNGNQVLAESLTRLSDALTLLASRVAAVETKVVHHDVAISKWDEAVGAIRSLLAEHIDDEKGILQSHGEMLARIDERTSRVTGAKKVL